jgi:hypothetical protein
LLICLAWLATLTGCAHVSTIPLGNAERLLAHPEFGAVRAAAPAWGLDAVETILYLEHELRDAAPFGVIEPAAPLAATPAEGGAQ